MNTLIDQTDLKILGLLSKNSRMSIKNISTSVNLSEPSVKKRMDKMGDMGIIKGFTTKINLQKIGYKILFFTKVSELSISNASFFKMINEMNEIIECYSITGKENYILKGVAENIQEIEMILSELIAISTLETSIVLEEIDLKTNLFIDAPL